MYAETALSVCIYKVPICPLHSVFSRQLDSRIGASSERISAQAKTERLHFILGCNTASLMRGHALLPRLYDVCSILASPIN